MTNLSGKPPLGLKQPKAHKTPKPMRQVSAKRQKHRASKEGKAEARHIGMVKMMACRGCGKAGPSEAHHCRDKPPQAEEGIYVRMPAGARRSSDYDAIALCPPCHEMFHLRRTEFHDKYGPDYSFIEETRAACGYKPPTQTKGEMP